MELPNDNSLSLNILCLHGRNSNNDITRFQTMGLRLGNYAKCEYLQAPHEGVPGRGLEHFSNGPWGTWYDKNDIEKTWNASLEYLANFVKNSPIQFHGVYAFSQGAAIVTAMSHPSVYRQYGFSTTSPPWRFCILACGGPADIVTEMVSSDGLLINVPSLHIMGKLDEHLADSTELQKHWNPTFRQSYTHGGGHEITMQLVRKEPELERMLDTFLNTQAQLLKQEEEAARNGTTNRHDGEKNAGSKDVKSTVTETIGHDDKSGSRQEVNKIGSAPIGRDDKSASRQQINKVGSAPKKDEAVDQGLCCPMDTCTLL